MRQLLILSLEVLRMHAIIVVNALTIRAGIHMRIKSCVNLKVKTNIILKFRYDVHSDWLKKLTLLKYKTHSKSCHIICHQLYDIICILIYTVCFQIVFLIISRFSWATSIWADLTEHFTKLETDFLFFLSHSNSQHFSLVSLYDSF